MYHPQNRQIRDFQQEVRQNQTADDLDSSRRSSPEVINRAASAKRKTTMTIDYIQTHFYHGFMLAILGAPVWVPFAMLAWHWFTAQSYWQFSLRFLFVLISVECLALVVSLAFYHFLTYIKENWPFPG
ncbi:hypothetical protein [Anatilimnocola floriformis]|uniref:hypothetical protein n=1 Tax=Anatilimnocola floriformis TaxID=2948575 RepID=UPI0020C3602F|nr:hypothetical protein [Anatilimnocola floriformis]